MPALAEVLAPDIFRQRRLRPAALPPDACAAAGGIEPDRRLPTVFSPRSAAYSALALGAFAR